MQMMSLRRASLFVTAFTIHLYAAAVGASDRYLPLSDGWGLQSSASLEAKGEAISTVGFDAKAWHATSVPATVLAALVEDKVYPDPFYGDNITKIPGYKAGRWLVMAQDSPFYPSWWYRTEFELPIQFNVMHAVLHLDGINYRANVWLNGKRVADDSTVIGMFRRFEFDVTEFVTPGQRNCLAIEVTGPGHLPEQNYRTKQIEATTGWDDHNPQPPDLNMGLWRDVYIMGTGPVALRHPYVAARLDLPSLETAHLTVSAHAINKTSEAVSGVLSGVIENVTTAGSSPRSGAIEKVEFEQPVSLGPKETKAVTFTPEAFSQLNISHPRVWWPVDLGPQDLYTAKLSFKCEADPGERLPRYGNGISDTAATRFGIREAATYINDEGWRGYRVNGKNVLIRGGAWMTCDMLLRLSPKRYEALVRYAKEGHLNMLRSEGFSIRETDDFYDLCDEYGIMVTQQIFGRSIPDEALAISCIEDTLLRIRNHPSLVHFLGHDETFPTETLDKAYRDLIAKYTPDRTYQPHSGAFRLEERFKTGGTRTGSLQVWTYACPSHYYTSKETGAWGFAQSGGIGGIFAMPESMRRMMPEEALWPAWTDIGSLHTVIQGGKYFNPVLKAINDRYGEPSNTEAASSRPAADFDDFMKKALALNYESARGMFEAYGRNKYSATGITTWKYDAAWPASPTWQYVDWYLNATAAYYGAQQACEPLHVLYAYDDHSIYVVNSLYKDFAGLKVGAELYNLDMTRKLAKDVTLDVPADAVARAFAVDLPPDVSKCYFLALKIEAPDGKTLSENFYWLSTVPDVENESDESFANPVSTADYKELNTLPAVKLNVDAKFEDAGQEKVARVTLDNPSPHLAFFVRLIVTKGVGGPEIAPVYWDANCVSLLPGGKRTLSARFAASDAEGATPAVKVVGWNVTPEN
jgi:exo-1,4-beta-D-glucosaminidase